MLQYFRILPNIESERPSLETVFNRYEKKYLLTPTKMNNILSVLKTRLSLDPYSQDGASYPIHNIYFDTSDYHIIRQSLSRKTYREKFRIRFYDYPLKPDSIVFLEIKKKLAGRGNKRRLPLRYKDAYRYMQTREKPTLLHPYDEQIFKEIDYFLSQYKVAPVTFIRYRRIALSDQHSDLRITFDLDIQYAKKASFENDMETYALPQSKDTIIMEIKSLYNYPLWLSNLLTENQVYASRFSKYGKTYELLHEGGVLDEHTISQP